MTSANRSLQTTAARVRKETDAAFAGMAEDASYQQEAHKLAEECAFSDWEALKLQE